MPSTTAITVSQLSRLVGLPGAPVIIDVRIDEDFDADPRLRPRSGAISKPFRPGRPISPASLWWSSARKA